MSEPRERVEGYHVPIHRGVWERINTFGAPRMWAMGWVVLCLLLALKILYLCGVVWLIAVGLLWALGQGLLVWLTLTEPYWDDMVVYMIRYSHRNRDFYEAGGRR